MEEWKTISFATSYKVSSSGRIKSVYRKGFKKLNYYNGGRARVQLKLDNGKYRNFLVHRLVALAFVENKHGYPQVNHIDHNPSNNNIENLEWCTDKQNRAHEKKRNLKICSNGEKNGSAKLSNSDVIKIKEFIASGKSLLDISKMFGVSKSAISGIKTGRTWSHIDLLHLLDI
jgi:hypothetical protein